MFIYKNLAKLILHKLGVAISQKALKTINANFKNKVRNKIKKTLKTEREPLQPNDE